MKALPCFIGCAIGLLASGGCSEDSSPEDSNAGNGGNAGAGSGATGSGGAAGTSSGGAGGGSGGSSGSGAGGSGMSGTGGMAGSGMTGAGGSGAGGSGTGGSGTVGAGGVGGTGSGTNVEIPGLACGGVLDANQATPFVQIGGRQVFIDYPCRKPSGTPVTFIFNLHGTMAQETGKHYIRGYFAAYKFLDTHNFVIATPKAVGSQWGNGDGGRDEPHLMEVYNWVYQNLAGFDIKQMWVVGHSWGAMYARTFACKTEFTDKVRGAILMSGGAGMPACASRLAVMGTVGETDIVTGELTQASAATGHGCDAQRTVNLGNNRITEWPACDAGWVHKNYFMLGKGHGFVPADWPDEGMNKDMADAVVSTR